MIKKSTKAFYIFIICVLAASAVNAQNIVVSGTVTDKETRLPVPGVSVTIKGTTSGTSTNQNGNYSFNTTARPPFTIVVSYVGHAPIERQVSSVAGGVNFELESGGILGQEVVISASRTPERILESPVTIERIGASAIKELPGVSFYDAILNLKGVEMSTQSLTFKSVNARGFNSNGNNRFNQFVDGMDNQAPGLNFSVGNIVGLSELDVDNVELLPGAASALYGAGGINGTLLMTSKNPFNYPGASFQYKTGVNHVNDNNSAVQEYKQFDMRLAKSWNNKFGVKATFSFLQAKDWQGNDMTNFDRANNMVKSGDRTSDPNYDGINVYGDEVSQNMRNVAQSVVTTVTNLALPTIVQQALGLPGAPTQAQIDAFRATPIGIATLNGFLASNPNSSRSYAGLNNPSLLPNQSVSRDGYDESALVDNNTKSLKTNISLNYRLTKTIEAIAQVNWGTGTSVYTGTERYSLRNFSIGQYKLELKGEDFFVRGYTTQERSGDSYIAAVLGLSINEVSSPSTLWFPTYVNGFVAARQLGQSVDAANAFARSLANASGRGRFLPGSANFEQAKYQIRNTNISSTVINEADPSKSVYGARFDDKTNLYHYEGMYNFTNALKNAVELQVGASSRLYQLRSGGTIFDDLNREINIKEYGAFAQLGKKLFSDKLKLTLAARYDKNSNFEGRVTPRFTGVYTVAKNNNIRLSYQTGYRNPTTQNQYIDLSVLGGQSRLIGGLPESLTKYDFYNRKGVLRKDYNAYLNSAAGGSPNAALLVPYTFDPKGLRPESVQSYELGYKGLITDGLLIDVYGYYNQYKDFITSVALYRAEPGRSYTSFGVPVNAAGKVTSYGSALGLDYLIGKYTLSGNVSQNALGKMPADYENDFNTPKVRFNVGFANREVVKNVGFNVQYRWQDSYYWLSSFAAGQVPAFSTVDAQANLKVPSINSIFKIGGSNLLNKYYKTSFGNPEVGALYYMSITFNP